jgi:NAD(P)-dependent dehydrogenase (short-subunit alcohol dehydrogenase family)
MNVSDGLMGLAGRAGSRFVNPRGRSSDEDVRAAVDGKVVLVTGASHGIGRASAERVARAGGKVLLVARSADLLEEIAEDLRSAGGEARAFPGDLTDLDAVGDLGSELLAEHGHVDFVVSNAGKSIRRPISASYDRFHDFTRTIGINYLGPVRLLLTLLPAMRERGGHIVNVSTIGVLVPPAPRWAAYVSSKAAFDFWLRSVAAETAADGVTATSIYMALVHTRMSAPTDDFDGVPGLSPEGAAELVCHALVKRQPAIAPWWATAASVFGDVARGPSEAFTRRYGSSLPDANSGAP